MAANRVETSERSDLVRGLGLWPATAIVIGDMIGTGVFLVASDMARVVGSARLVLAAWILGAVHRSFWCVLLRRIGRSVSQMPAVPTCT